MKKRMQSVLDRLGNFSQQSSVYNVLGKAFDTKSGGNFFAENRIVWILGITISLSGKVVIFELLLSRKKANESGYV